MGDRGNMEAVKDPHTFICSRGCQLGAWELSEEGSDKHTHFNHDQVGCNASSRTRGEWLELILDQGLAL